MPPVRANNHHLHFFQALVCALNGWRWAWSERNIRIHVGVLLAVVGAGFVVGLERWEWVSVLIVSGLVLTAELLNTAVEWLSDVVSPEYDELIGKIKDVSAGGVLMATVVAIMVGVVVFGPYFF